MAIVAKNQASINRMGCNCIWVDRRSALGNPFKLSGTCTREQSIALYRKHLWEQITKYPNGACMKELRVIAEKEKRYGSVYLICWCKPLPCHADIIIRCIEWLKSQNFELLRQMSIVTESSERLVA